MKKLLFALTLFCSSLHAIPEPYNSIHVLPFDSHGWFGNAKHLDALLTSRDVQIVIEVGSWLGCSTRHLASSIPYTGRVYAVDTWQGSPEEQVHMQDPRLPTLYQQFLSNVIHAGLTDKIIPIRMNSLEAASALNVNADLIYLDAAHDFISVLNDIAAWYPHLKKEGIICGDDWLWETVRIAVINSAMQLGKKVHSIDNFWWYE